MNVRKSDSFYIFPHIYINIRETIDMYVRKRGAFSA